MRSLLLRGALSLLLLASQPLYAFFQALEGQAQIVQGADVEDRHKYYSTLQSELFDKKGYGSKLLSRLLLDPFFRREYGKIQPFFGLGYFRTQETRSGTLTRLSIERQVLSYDFGFRFTLPSQGSDFQPFLELSTGWVISGRTRLETPFNSLVYHDEFGMGLETALSVVLGAGGRYNLGRRKAIIFGVDTRIGLFLGFDYAFAPGKNKD